ncbi:serine/threonine-protein kinase [Nannocystis sp. RBIL2]|uniref:serine/threonine-protein kinase n=1 Tax=Nannocystis sp. RBIL2 TaxID=2996788 RepID=UPI002270497B|nr:serine/threonine-protein kinase [Nannocystis sp. RBIL2]MCY1071186.1 serine/threonine-protein kinase [Nannocystis sp. RBIL2]
MELDDPSVSSADAQHVSEVMREHPLGASRLGDLEARLHKERLREKLLGSAQMPVVVGARWVLREKIDGGGMGVVFRAFDPKLQRDIALKVLRRGASGSPEDRRKRLEREARAMAKVEHRNVVHVYDFHVDDDPEELTFVVMEFVAGTTLRGWLKASPRTWPEIAKKFLDAAQGIACVHGHDIVHRDIKPDNILIRAADEWVLLGDFGLVRAPADDAQDLRSPAVDEAGQTPLRLTPAGGVVGTLPYVAPEHFDRGEADSRSDQYSFFVSFHEALYKKHPYSGSSAAELRNSIREGLKPLEAGPLGVPRWLREALHRGLSEDPTKRFGSMKEVIGTLERGLNVARLRPLAYTLFTAVLITILGALTWPVRQRPCENLERNIAGLWDEPGRGSGSFSFDAGESSTAAHAPQFLQRGFEDYRETWLELKRDTCRLRAAPDDDTNDERMRLALAQDACLGESLGLARAIGKRTQEGGAAVDAATPELVQALQDSVTRCRFPGSLAPGGPRDVASLHLLSTARERISDARVQEYAGNYEAALRLANESLVVGSTIGDRVLTAESLLRLGRTHSLLRQRELASAALRRAQRLAQSAQHAELIHEASVELMKTLILDFEDITQAKFIADAFIRPAIEGWTAHQPRRQADGHEALGILARAEGRSDAAIEHHEAALALRRGVGGWGPTGDSFRSLLNLANVLSEPGTTLEQRSRARSLYKESLQLAVAAFGGLHPRTLEVRTTYALFLDEGGEQETAREQLALALPAAERYFGKESWRTGKLHLQLGRLALVDNDRATAQAHLDSALPLLKTHAAREHVHGDFVTALHFRALLHRDAGEYHAALSDYQTILDLLGPAPRDRFTYRQTLIYHAEALLHQGAADDAIRSLERAQAHAPASGDDLDVLLLAALADGYHRMGRKNEARAAANDAAAAYTRLGLADPELIDMIERARADD